MPGSSEILLGTAACFEYSRSYLSYNIRCDHDVIDTYLSLRYIYYNYCGPVYIKLNFEALRVLRQCEPLRVFASGRWLISDDDDDDDDDDDEIRLYMSHFSRIS